MDPEKYKRLSRFKFSTDELTALNEAEQYFKDHDIAMFKLAIHVEKLKIYNVSFSSLVRRLKCILELGKDSSSKKSHLYRYGWAGFKLFKQKGKNCSNTAEELIAKFGEEYQIVLDSRGASFENYITRHGIMEGTKRWNLYLEKRAATYVEKRESGHEYPKYNLDYFIGLYGVMVGSAVYFKKIEDQRYKVSREYYIEQYGEELGTLLCKENKTHTSKDAFIKKYGTIDGTKKYLAYITLQSRSEAEKCKAAHGDNWEEVYNARFRGTLACYIKRFGEEEGTRLYDIRFEKFANLPTRTRSRSYIATELFDYLQVFVNDLYNYGDHEISILLTKDERQIYNRCFVRPDLVYNKKIIEFQGDTYHANPSVYTELDTPNPYRKELTAKEIWENDETKRRIYEDKGYELLIIWASEYRSNKLQTVEKCLEFLKD